MKEAFDIVFAEGGAETLLPYEIPFAHDGFGQDEEWVRANFANADGILASGYRVWVDAQVGEGERNGFYSLSASFPAAPPYAVELAVGGLSVCVTNAGEYVFLLEKGARYAFNIQPHDAQVGYSVCDDIGRLDSSHYAVCQDEDDGERIMDDGILVLLAPTPTESGVCFWKPTSQDAPETTNVSFSVSAPKIVFVNVDHRTSRWYSVSMALDSPVATNATLSLRHYGKTGVSYSSDACGENELVLRDMQMETADDSGKCAYQLFFSCANTGNGRFEATCTLPDGNALKASHRYTAIEPLRKLISTNPAPNGGYVNPSRLVYGSEAWLEVGGNGNSSDLDVRWRVVSGPGVLSSVDRQRACLRAAAPTGVVVVEASFGDDAHVQPRFVLPIVRKRRIPARVCIVADDGGVPVVAETCADRLIEAANDVMTQVGVEFFRSSEPQIITNSLLAEVGACSRVTNANGKVVLSPYASVSALNLFSQVDLPNGEEVKLCWVDRIVDGTPIAFSVRDEKACVFSSRYQVRGSVVAHELGHLLGLEDVYDIRPRGGESIPEGDLPLCSSVFLEHDTDWIGDDGCGFYESSDTHVDALRSLLMYGHDCGGTDIPSGAVRGYSVRSRHILDIKYVPVGASSMEARK